MNLSDDPFAGLEHDLGAVACATPKPADPEWTNPCPKCHGSGKYRHLGPCFMCKGKGVLTFRTSPEQRARDQAARHERKVGKSAQSLDAFAAAHPTEWAWIVARRAHFEFAANMETAIKQYGDLTERQLAAVQRLVEKDALRNVDRAERQAQARDVNVAGIVRIFANASASGLKRPRLRVGKLMLALAAPTGRNPGFVYVTDITKEENDGYLGKISPAGLFSPSRICSADDLKTIQATDGNPLEQAVAYGRMTGSCACCGRELTDPESVRRGIGPICAGKWGL